MKKSFVLYLDDMDQLEGLNDEQYGRIFRAIVCYAAGKELPELDGITSMAFGFIRRQLDRDHEKYQSMIERRSEAGKTGMSHRWGNSSKPKRITNDNSVIPAITNDNSVIPAITKITVADAVADAVAVADAEKKGKEKRDEKESDADASVEEVSFSGQIATIRELYGSVCGSYPRLAKMTEGRKRALKARLRSGYTVDDFRRLFELAEASDFLKGRNNRNWSANFDWLIKDSNMAKVLEGRYSRQDDDSGGDNGDSGGTIAADYYKRWTNSDGDG